MRKHLKTVSSALAALGLVSAAFAMSAPAMAMTPPPCTLGTPSNTCTLNQGYLFQASVQTSGGYYYTCVSANNPASTSKKMYFRYSDSTAPTPVTYHDFMDSGKSNGLCNLTGLLPNAIQYSTCGFDSSCG
jgi:hypothetical protein